MKRSLFILLLAAAATFSAQAVTDLTVNCGDSVWISATPATGYHFVSWQDGDTLNPRRILATGNLTFTASFDINQYRIRFVNVDGTELWSTKVNHGVMPVYGGETPTIDGDAQYTYDFRGWSPALHNADAHAVYTAEYDSIVNSYTIRFLNYDGAVLSSQSVKYGQMPVYDGNTPAKQANAQYSYSFKGWSPAIASVTGHADYVAEFDSTLNKYRIEWYNDNGELLRADSVAYGLTPTYGEQTPTKAATAQYSFTFDGWNPAIVAVTGDAAYTATYQSVVNRYDITVTAENGQVVGSGNYEYGEQVQISVTPNDCYHFTAWSDNDSNATRTITVTGDATYTATCDIDTFTIHVEVAPDSEGQGTVSVSLTKPE